MAAASLPDLAWVKSTRCDSGHCVEVAVTGAAVLIRDSKDAAGQPLAFDHAAWRTFLGSLGR